MREQKGRVFHKGPSWFVQYRDDVIQPDGTIKRVQVCKKLKRRTAASTGPRKPCAHLSRKSSRRSTPVSSTRKAP